MIDLSKNEKIAKEDEKVILKVYEELNAHLNPEDNEHLISEEDWWNDFIKERIFWTDKEEFWCNENDVFINDNEDLYKHFKNNPKSAYLKLGLNYHPKIQYFIEATNVSYLSKALKTKLTNSKTSKIEHTLTDQIQKFIPYILRYLYQSYNSTYEKL